MAKKVVVVVVVVVVVGGGGGQGRVKKFRARTGCPSLLTILHLCIAPTAG